MKTHSEKFLRQRRFYTVLPVLVIPFLVVIFWSLGGGQALPAQATLVHTGFDVTLPDAHFPKEKKSWNKLNYYEQAEKDSIKRHKAKTNDPYYSLTELSEGKERIDSVSPSSQSANDSAALNASVEAHGQKDTIEEKINSRLRQLYQQIKPPAQEQPIMANQSEDVAHSAGAFSDDVSRLERMMERMQHDGESDPEMQQIQTVLDKILDIQHPERERERIRQQSLDHAEQVFPVVTSESRNTVFLFGSNLRSGDDTSQYVTSNERPVGFLGLMNEEVTQVDSERDVIHAIIHGTQELKAGEEVKIRLLQDIYINGKLIPNGEVVFGTCAVNGDRFTIFVNAIALLPVSLKVYDLNGSEGIHIPGSMTGDAARQGSNQAIQDLRIYDGLDASPGVQAASAGIQAAKGLFARKARIVKGTVKAGYQIVLKNANNRS